MCGFIDFDLYACRMASNELLTLGPSFLKSTFGCARTREMKMATYKEGTATFKRSRIYVTLFAGEESRKMAEL